VDVDAGIRHAAPDGAELYAAPLAPLLAVVSPPTWVRLFYITQTLLGAFGMWRLCAKAGITPVTRAVCVLSFVFATPTLNYVITDLWPTFYMTWTSSPWLVLLAWNLLDANDGDAFCWSVWLGLCGGLALASTHPSYSPIYGTVVAAILIARWRQALTRWPWLALAAMLALAIAGPNLVQLLQQRSAFDPAFAIVKYVDPLPLSAIWDVFVRPFSFSEHPWEVEVVNRGSRLLFFGGPFAVLALAGLVRFGRRHLDLALGVILSSVLLFTRLLPLTFVSRFEFRDPLILCAIPLAGLMADRLVAGRATRVVGVILLFLQAGIVGAAASPYFDTMWSPEAKRATWFRGATGESDFVDTLHTALRVPGRVAFSSRLDGAVSNLERLQDGLGVNSLAYRGIPVVNGLFKVISTDVLWPDDRLYYGRIRVPPRLIESRDGLNFLGIRYVLAYPDERVAPGLREIWPPIQTVGAPLLVYENESASAGAAVFDDAAQLPVLPAYADCPNDRLLCRDFEPLVRLERPDRVAVTRDGPEMLVNVDRADAPRLLVLVELFRPGWVATADGRPVTTVSVGPGLLGLRLPPGVTDLHLEYRAIWFTAATIVAWAALTGAVLALLLLSMSSRSRAIK
jgi:hypothetical protein